MNRSVSQSLTDRTVFPEILSVSLPVRPMHSTHKFRETRLDSQPLAIIISHHITTPHHNGRSAHQYITITQITEISEITAITHCVVKTESAHVFTCRNDFAFEEVLSESEDVSVM